jgi:Cation transporter/ATPase, N-terminus
VHQSKETQARDVPVAELLERLQTSADDVSRSEVERRLARYGYNAPDGQGVNQILKFLSYF